MIFGYVISEFKKRGFVTLCQRWNFLLIYGLELGAEKE
jgi:hypothetical protein